MSDIIQTMSDIIQTMSDFVFAISAQRFLARNILFSTSPAYHKKRHGERTRKYFVPHIAMLFGLMLILHQTISVQKLIAT